MKTNFEEQIVIRSTKTLHPYKELVSLIKDADSKFNNLNEILSKRLNSLITKETVQSWRTYWTTIPLAALVELCFLLNKDFESIKKYLPEFALIETSVKKKRVKFTLGNKKESFPKFVFYKVDQKKVKEIRKKLLDKYSIGKISRESLSAEKTIKFRDLSLFVLVKILISLCSEKHIEKILVGSKIYNGYHSRKLGVNDVKKTVSLVKRKTKDNLKILRRHNFIKELNKATFLILNQYRARSEDIKELFKSFSKIFGREGDLGLFLGETEKAISYWIKGKREPLLGQYIILCFLANRSLQDTLSKVSVIINGKKVSSELIFEILNGDLRKELKKIRFPHFLINQINDFDFIPVMINIKKEITGKLIRSSLSKLGTKRLVAYYLGCSPSDLNKLLKGKKVPTEKLLKLCFLSGTNPKKILSYNKSSAHFVLRIKNTYLKKFYEKDENFRKLESSLAVHDSNQIKKLLHKNIKGKLVNEIDNLLSKNKRVSLVLLRKLCSLLNLNYTSWLTGKTIVPKIRSQSVYKLTIPEKVYSRDLSYLAAIIVSDGSVNSGGVSVTSKNLKFLLNEIKPKFEKYFELPQRLDKGTRAYRLIIPGMAMSYFFSLYYDLPIGYKCSKVVVPEAIQKNNHFIHSFLSGLFDGDGYLDKEGGIEFSTLSVKLVVSLNILLSHLGLKNIKIDIEKNPKKYRTRFLYRIKLGRRNTKNIIPILKDGKSYKLEKYNLGDIKWI